MKFSELVLKSRTWLFDYRERTGQVIDVASKDGIRWTSIHVQTFCKDAIIEMLRLFTAMKLDALVDKASFYRIVGGLSIEAGTGLLKTLDTYNFTSIIKLQTTDLQRIYSPDDQDKFFSNRYFTKELLDGSRPLDDGVFSVFFNIDTKKRVVHTLPLYADDIINVQAVMRIPYTEILTLDSIDELPILDSEDILKLFIMRNARHTEHNTVMVKDLNDQIQQKFMELGVGIPRASA